MNTMEMLAVLLAVNDHFEVMCSARLRIGSLSAKTPCQPSFLHCPFLMDDHPKILNPSPVQSQGSMSDS